MKYWVLTIIALILASVTSYAKPEHFEKEILQAYLSDEKVNSILASPFNQKHLTPQITTSEFVGDKYRAIVQMGYGLSNGTFDFNYMPNLLRIYEINPSENNVIVDLTLAPLPETKIWAHFQVSQGGAVTNWVAPDKKNPTFLKLVKIKNIPVLYNVSTANPGMADLYIPIESSDLKQKLRIAILAKQTGNSTQFSIAANNELRITLGKSGNIEECDGPFSFGIKGGGKTGWCPWNQSFIQTVTDIKPGYDLSKGVKSANQLFVP